MKSRPSNVIIKAIIGILTLFALYALGGFFISLSNQTEPTPTETRRPGEGL